MKRYLFLLIVLGAVPAIAQVPSGPFSYVFTNLPLWDATSIYTNVMTTSAGTDHNVMQIAQSAKGIITGTRTDTITGAGTLDASINTTLKGHMFDKGGVTGANVGLKGTVTIAAGYSGPAKGKFKVTVDEAALSLDVVGSIKLCVKTPIGKKCETVPLDTTHPLPAGVDGDWALDMAITATGNKLTGTGTLTLSNARVLSYQVHGVYHAPPQTTKLMLTGQGDAIGTHVLLTTTGAGLDLVALKGNVLGQKPMFP